MARENTFACDPDRQIEMIWGGSTVRIRQWYDSGKIAVWRARTMEWDAIMHDYEIRYHGWFDARYDDWCFPGSHAAEAEAALRKLCS